MHSNSIRPAEISSEALRAKYEYFIDVQLWPLQSTINPGAWLANFTACESRHAEALLNAVIYLNDNIVDSVFRSTVQSLSDRFADMGPLPTVQAFWTNHFDHLLVTFPTGEVPSATDSGYAFARKARQECGFAESQVLEPGQAVQAIADGLCDTLVFVDDFAGTGNQFIETWNRRYSITGSAIASFREMNEAKPFAVYYCPIVSTDLAASRIEASCPGVILRPGHLVSPRYSVFAEDSLVWPESLAATAEEFIFSASQRAGIPDAPGTPKHWRGFADLGLTIAFAGSVPDATIPLVYWESDAWTPLIRRR